MKQVYLLVILYTRTCLAYNTRQYMHMKPYFGAMKYTNAICPGIQLIFNNVHYTATSTFLIALIRVFCNPPMSFLLLNSNPT